MSTQVSGTVIFTMKEVSRFHGKKQVLKDIYLGFYYGAKIGVLGLNGAGKSTLLRIMAGVDKDFKGEVLLSKGYSVGMLEQEPQLDKSKTVRGVVEEGAAETVKLLKDFSDVSEKLGDPNLTPEDMEKLLDKQGKLQEKIDAAGAWELDSKLDLAMDALRCPPPDTPVANLSGGERRRVALCRLLVQEPDILL
ncbi:MAG: ATP-binding cassette domain-containing protein, partial [Elusimicrobia bacterium]|nr:ATP-binding cassette domain-containing protein [Elusimicrobiota bacterium]